MPFVKGHFEETRTCRIPRVLRRKPHEPDRVIEHIQHCPIPSSSSLVPPRVERTATNNSATDDAASERTHVERSPPPQRAQRIQNPAPVDGLLVHYTKYPNWWSRVREFIRVPEAEFFGTMILTVFGSSCPPISKISPTAKGDYLSLTTGWAVGTALGVWFAGGSSGGHINPAITLAMAAFRDFPWRRVSMYIIAQLLGALCGAAIVYANNLHAIDIYEGGRHTRTIEGTAYLFSTYALDYMTNVSCFFDEVISSAALMLIVCALTDKNNGPPPSGLVPLALFLALLGIGTALGMQTRYAIGPARDLGLRILTAMVGYGKQVFTYRNQYWLWCPIIGPIVGAMLGTLIYDAFIFTGGESVLNKPDARSRAAHERVRMAQKQKPPAGFDNCCENV